jgi:hypothetical protein
MLPGVVESGQAFIERVASADQWAYIYTFLA